MMYLLHKNKHAYNKYFTDTARHPIEQKFKKALFNIELALSNVSLIKQRPTTSVKPCRS